jgi:hypothetical protein
MKHAKAATASIHAVSDVRRALLNAVGVLLLAAGPVLPSFHLATSPHRYCALHRTFEGIRRPPSAPPERGSRKQRGSEDDEHVTCLLAALMLQLVEHEPGAAALDPWAPLPVAQAVASRRTWPRGPIDLVFLAPKNSPPMSAQS